MAPKTSVNLTVDADLNEWATAAGLNRSKIFEDALRREKGIRELAVGVVYSNGDKKNRMARAIALIQEAQGKEDNLEGRISAAYVAKKQAQILGELWPDVSFNWVDLFHTARRELKMAPVELTDENPQRTTF